MPVPPLLKRTRDSAECDFLDRLEVDSMDVQDDSAKRSTAKSFLRY